MSVSPPLTIGTIDGASAYFAISPATCSACHIANGLSRVAIRKRREDSADWEVSPKAVGSAGEASAGEDEGDFDGVGKTIGQFEKETSDNARRLPRRPLPRA